MILFFVLGNTVSKVQAQCGIAQLTITDSATTKALRGYIRRVISPRIMENLTIKKTAIVLLEETRHGVADGRDVKAFHVAICENNYFKYHKMVINGYFQLDNVLYLVTSPLFGSFKTNNYDYDNPCLSKILSNHSLKEYDPPKTIKKTRNNIEITMRELGDNLNIYGCTIILDSKNNTTGEDYRLLLDL